MTRPRYFIDENLMGLAKTWGADRSDCCWPGHNCEVSLGDPDTTWVPLIAAQRLVAITQDKKLNRNPAEIDAILRTKLRVVRLTIGRKQRSIQDLGDRLDRHWARIEDFVVERPKGPWLLAVGHDYVEELGVGSRSTGWGRSLESRGD